MAAQSAVNRLVEGSNPSIPADTLFDNKDPKYYNNSMKKCSMCKEEKKINEFNKNSSKKDGLQTMCRLCWKTYYKEKYYKSGNEKQRLLEKNKKNRDDIKKLIQESKNIPCMDCGISYPYYVMDFDHRDPSSKKYTIASMTNVSNIEKVKKEIDKCDVVCSNCHRIRTYS